MKKLFFSSLFAILCIAVNAQQKLGAKDLEELKGWMIGSFSSELQAKSDTDYYDIRLHMAQIWNDRKDGYWLYIEQAMSSNIRKPYRQRIYHLYQKDEKTFVSKVYELKNAPGFVGAWATPANFSSLSIDSLVDRQGCGISLQKNDRGEYVGSTPGKECLSQLRGATYATSEVVIDATKMVSWDRGWSKDDKQVWGAEKGGYVFVKQAE
jgi:CpeT protein